MDPATCPFVASPGARPPRLAGRSDALELLGDTIGALHRADPGRTIAWLGRIGTGRTVLLHEAARRAAAQGWAAAVIGIDAESPIEHHLARGVAAAIVHLGRRHPDEPKLVELLGVTRAYASAHGLELPIETPIPEISWPGNRRSDAGALFERVADGLRGIGSGCFLALDDLDRADRSARDEVLAAAAQLSGAGRSFLAAATGLPGSVGPDLADIVVLGPLTPPDVYEAIAEPASTRGAVIGPDTVAAIGRRTAGHPAYVQAFARAAWIEADGHLITPEHVRAVTLPVERELRTAVFSPVLDGLSPSELRFVRAIADADQRDDFAGIARRLGDAVRFDPATSRLAPLRDTLLERGVIYVSETGALRFALPFLERYVRSTD